MFNQDDFQFVDEPKEEIKGNPEQVQKKDITNNSIFGDGIEVEAKEGIDSGLFETGRSSQTIERELAEKKPIEKAKNSLKDIFTKNKEKKEQAEKDPNRELTPDELNELDEDQRLLAEWGTTGFDWGTAKLGNLYLKLQDKPTVNEDELASTSQLKKNFEKSLYRVAKKYNWRLTPEFALLISAGAMISYKVRKMDELSTAKQVEQNGTQKTVVRKISRNESKTNFEQKEQKENAFTKIVKEKEIEKENEKVNLNDVGLAGLMG